MNTDRTITEADLEDGSLLEAAVTAFNNERTEEHLINILTILRDSYVWIPCTAVMSEEDQNHLNDIAQKLKDNPDMDPTELSGMEFRTEGITRMIPDILQNGDLYFFPVFSTVEAMRVYGHHFSKVQRHMLEAVSLAEHNERELAGIVLNAFTEPFVLDSRIFDIVKKMKSRIAE